MSGGRPVNLVVIGKAPRPQLQAEFARVLGDQCPINTIGALDRLSVDEIRAHPPQSDADTLFTILPDGTSMLVSKALVTDQLRRRLAEQAGDGAGLNALCCTGRFPEFAGHRIITASQVLANVVQSAAALTRSPGVFIPALQQVENARARWRENGFDPVVVPLAPDAADSDVDAAAERMRAHAPDLIIYDCISYRHATRQRVERHCDAPAIVAVSALAHVIAELRGS